MVIVKNVRIVLEVELGYGWDFCYQRPLSCILYSPRRFILGYSFILLSVYFVCLFFYVYTPTDYLSFNANECIQGIETDTPKQNLKKIC